MNRVKRRIFPIEEPDTSEITTQATVTDETDDHGYPVGLDYDGNRAFIGRVTNAETLQGWLDAGDACAAPIYALQQQLDALTALRDCKTLAELLTLIGGKDCPIGTHWPAHVEHTGREALALRLIAQQATTPIDDLTVRPWRDDAGGLHMAKIEGHTEAGDLAALLGVQGLPDVHRRTLLVWYRNLCRVAGESSRWMLDQMDRDRLQAGAVSLLNAKVAKIKKKAADKAAARQWLRDRLDDDTDAALQAIASEPDKKPLLEWWAEEEGRDQGGHSWQSDEKNAADLQAYEDRSPVRAALRRALIARFGLSLVKCANPKCIDRSFEASKKCHYCKRSVADQIEAAAQAAQQWRDDLAEQLEAAARSAGRDEMRTFLEELIGRPLHQQASAPTPAAEPAGAADLEEPHAELHHRLSLAGIATHDPETGDVFTVGDRIQFLADERDEVDDLYSEHRAEIQTLHELLSEAGIRLHVPNTDGEAQHTVAERIGLLADDRDDLVHDGRMLSSVQGALDAAGIDTHADDKPLSVLDRVVALFESREHWQGLAGGAGEAAVHEVLDGVGIDRIDTTDGAEVLLLLSERVEQLAGLHRQGLEADSLIGRLLQPLGIPLFDENGYDLALHERVEILVGRFETLDSKHAEQAEIEAEASGRDVAAALGERDTALDKLADAHERGDRLLKRFNKANADKSAYVRRLRASLKALVQQGTLGADAAAQLVADMKGSK